MILPFKLSPIKEGKRYHMKRPRQLLILFVVICLPVCISAQVEDGFEDMDFTKNPTWMGDTGQFKVNAAHQLQLKSAGSDTSYLSVRNTRIENTEWHFWIKLSFNSSSNNYARVYLASDQTDLTNDLNGYYLQIGGSNDSLAFFYQNGTLTEKLFQGVYAHVSHATNILRIQVVHDSVGTWHVYSDTLGGVSFVEEGSFFHDKVQTTTWFGVYCRYTTSNSSKFYFDDFYIGPVQIDTIPPSVSALTIMDSNQIEIMFSENVDQNFAEEPLHYTTIGAGSPSQVSVDFANPRKVTLIFQNDFKIGRAHV